MSVRKEYILLPGNNEFECLQLILLGWLKGMEMFIFPCGYPPRVINALKHIPFIRRYITKSIKEHKASFGDYKGLWYETSTETIKLTVEFYNQKIKDKNKIVAYYDRILNTNKSEAYLKKNISYQIFALLRDLHFIRLSDINQNRILAIKNPITEFVIKYIEDKYKIKYRLRWILPTWALFSMCTYCVWLFEEIMKRGVVFNRKRKIYKISMEAAWGFSQRTLRNDIMIDNERFKPSDVLILELYEKSTPNRIRALKEAKEKGFDTASIPKSKINITKNIFSLLVFYLFIPIKVYVRLFFKQELYLFYYILSFHRKCFRAEVLMNLYSIKCHISMIDHGDIATTIMLNKYGAKNIILQWTDSTSFKSCTYAFNAHNIFFVWGDIHYDLHSDNYFVDRKVNIGCVYKREYTRAVENKERIIAKIVNLKKGKRIASFFDTSFHNFFYLAEHLFLEYLEIVKDFCKMNKELNVLLKPKSEESYATRISKGNQARFKKIWDELVGCDNFIYLNPLEWSAEKIIAISDVCINMSMNSPATIALICGKNALYFDNTGNNYHPFAEKHRNTIVFEDKDLLFKQINNILNGKFNCRDVISEREIREYDAFSDDNSLQRMQDNLYELTLTD